MKGSSHTSFNWMTTDTHTLCNDDENAPIQVQIFKWKKSGTHDMVAKGTVQLKELNSLQPGEESKTVALTRGYSFLFNQLRIQKRASFLDYVFGGCEIKCHVAIDYTMSNGPPNDRASLHYLGGHNQDNQYTTAIKSVMNVLNDYDYDQMYPVYGFGGRVNETPHGGASHCFALNGDIFRPEVKGVHGILEAYYQSINNVNLSGPTHFNKVLEYVNGFAKYSETEIS